MNQKNKREVEVKLLFKDKKGIISKLGQEMKFKKRANIYDRYYGQKNLDMYNIHPLIRIRNINNKETELTYKGAVKDKNNIWHREELTIKIASPKIISKILMKLGFKEISEYRSKREYWKYNGLEIIFTKFTSPSCLEFVEIEGSSEKKIKNTIQKLGNNVKEVGEEIFEIFDKKRSKK